MTEFALDGRGLILNAWSKFQSPSFYVVLRVDSIKLLPLDIIAD